MTDVDYRLLVGKLYDDANLGQDISIEMQKCKRAAERLDVDWHSARSENRTQVLSDFRFMCFKYLRDKGFTYKEIGRAFGNRDHTTTLYGVKQANALIEVDYYYRKRWRIFKQS